MYDDEPRGVAAAFPMALVEIWCSQVSRQVADPGLGNTSGVTPYLSRIYRILAASVAKKASPQCIWTN
jgi:hypothetical protein